MTNLFTPILTDEEVEAAEEILCDIDMLIDRISHTGNYAPNALPSCLLTAVESLRLRVQQHAVLDF